MSAAESHALVDVLAGGKARFIEPRRVRQEWDEQQVDDEATTVLRDDDVLAQQFAEFAGFVERLSTVDDAPHSLEELHHWLRVEEVTADDALGPRGDARDLDDGQCLGVRGEEA